MDTKRFIELQEEFKWIIEEIDECPESDRKKLHNLVKKRERLVMEIQDLLSNKQ